jgi:hypothetical protein
MVLRAITVEAGQRAHADVEVRTGPLSLAVKVRGADDQPLAAEAIIATPPLGVRDGEPLQVLLARLAPAEPTTWFQARAPATFESLPPGRYTVCAAVPNGKGRFQARVFCTERELTVSGEVEVVVPSSALATK